MWPSDKDMKVLRDERSNGDRAILLACGLDDGGVAVREEVTGPAAGIVYGEEPHRLTVLFPMESCQAIVECLCDKDQVKSRDWVHQLFVEKGLLLADAMDFCDKNGLRYGYEAEGPLSGMSFRRERGEGAIS